MRILIVLIALAIAGPALAVPPVAPRKADLDGLNAYATAVAQRDLNVYGALFTADAQITKAKSAFDKSEWLEAVTDELKNTHQARLLTVFGTMAVRDGKPVTKFRLAREFQSCAPMMMECFGAYRTETLTFRDGKIIGLEVDDDYTFRQTSSGGWTFFYGDEGGLRGYPR